MNLIFTLLLMVVPADAQTAQPSLCKKAMRIEKRLASNTPVQLFARDNSSGTFLADMKSVTICNDDTTAANKVFRSTWQVTNLVAGAPDTAKADTIDGGTSRSDRCATYEQGPNIPIWVWRLVGFGNSTITGIACE